MRTDASPCSRGDSAGTSASGLSALLQVTGIIGPLTVCAYKRKSMKGSVVASTGETSRRTTLGET